ncbi:hypothetical protein Tco_0844493 [Tanacetum coccineum]
MILTWVKFNKTLGIGYNCGYLLKRRNIFVVSGAPKNQENRNKENTRRVVPVEITTSNALISCDSLGDYDWSDQAEEGPTNFALMAYSSISSNFEVSTDSNYSSSCLENFKILKEQNEKLLKDLRTSKINVITYKAGLEFVEARLLVYKKIEFVYEEDIKLLKFKKLVVETSKAKASADKPKAVKKNNGALIIEEWVSGSEEEDMPQAKIQRKIVKPSFAKIDFAKSKEQVKTPRKTTVKQGSNLEMINKACYVCESFDHMQYNCDNHQRQFNNKKMVKPVWNYTQRVNHQNFSRMTHPSPKRNMVPKEVLMRSGLVSLTTARPVNTAQPRTIVNSARPMTNVFNKAHSTVRNQSRDMLFRGNQVNVVNGNQGNPQMDLQDQGVIDSGCLRHMIGNMSYLTDFEEIDG